MSQVATIKGPILIGLSLEENMLSPKWNKQTDFVQECQKQNVSLRTPIILKENKPPNKGEVKSSYTHNYYTNIQGTIEEGNLHPKDDQLAI